MGPTRIHHINFVVRDLEAAIERFETKLGFPPFTVIDHAARGSRIAHTSIGESVLVLVCPYEDESVPGRHLREHGEGFFLLSLGVADLEDAIRRLDDAGPVRDGIDDWRIADIGRWAGAEMQLTDDASADQS